jgi:hypothetical protein
VSDTCQCPRCGRLHRKLADNPPSSIVEGWQEPKVPCGECHLRPGELCDICGARATAATSLAAQKAYGVLWREVNDTSPLIREARMQLRDSLTQEERRVGIAWAIEAFGPVTDMEAIAADMRAGVFPQRSN